MSFWDHAFVAVGGVIHHVQNEVVPVVHRSLGGAATQVGHNFHHHVAPAVGGVIAHVQHNIAPAIAYNVAYRLYVHVIPAVIQIGNVVHNIGPVIKEAIGTAIARFRVILGENFEKAPQVLLQSVEEAGNWVKENPGKTALLVVCSLALIAPVIIVGPALGGLGFGAGGIAAGSTAAGIHAGIGSVAAGSVFAVLQSAGAGGAGLLIVNGVVQGVAAAGLASTIAASVSKTKAIKEQEEGEHGDDQDEREE
ncbi:hypothetical protein E2P81_ATG11901 [Venturia nashicola]|uniref:Uncharacterized protein n=1 Tax=Venturia nashicola TaxID=86259 RepID=A0A4Z1NKW4_9PEZI|nr:hypothetical protein E6O75_ATG11594 [Venturia nashicola]TLD24565.1 hypothetical protein E2P81_ATG11901 [Venturia nashicola]